jgi:hypothetical protein
MLLEYRWLPIKKPVHGYSLNRCVIGLSFFRTNALPEL